MLTRRQRKKLGQKARSWDKGTTPPGNYSSPTDKAPQKAVKKRAQKPGKGALGRAG